MLARNGFGGYGHGKNGTAAQIYSANNQQQYQQQQRQQQQQQQQQQQLQHLPHRVSGNFVEQQDGRGDEEEGEEDDEEDFYYINRFGESPSTGEATLKGDGGGGGRKGHWRSWQTRERERETEMGENFFFWQFNLVSLGR